MSGRGGIIPWRLRPSQRQSHTAVLCSQTDCKDEIRKMQEADRAALAMALGMEAKLTCVAAASFLQSRKRPRDGGVSPLRTVGKMFTGWSG
jgi:hypothetical protein